MTRIRSYFGRHWRGELSLPVSYWLGALVANALGAAASWPLLYLLTKAQVETAFAWYYVWSWTVTAVVTSWALVGVWRSAQRRLAAGPEYWAQLAKYVVLLNVVLTTAVFCTSGIASIREGLAFSRTLRGFAGEVRVLPGGTDMELAGGIGFGFADKVIGALDANPGVKTIQTNLYKGGLIDEATKLSAEITRRGLATNVSGACVSACTVVYLGGVERTVGSKARIGFHRPFVPGGSVLGESFLGANAAAFMTSRGVDKTFAARAMKTGPSGMWFPEFDDMLAAKFADKLASPSEEVAAGPPLESDRRQTDAEFQKTRLYRALKRVAPDSYARIVDLFVLGTATGRSAAELNRDLLPEIAATFQRELPFADDAALAKLAQLNADQFRALAKISTRACWAAVTGAAKLDEQDSWAKLPADIQTRSTDVMTAALESVDAARPPDSARDAQRTLAKAREDAARRLKSDGFGKGLGPEEKEQTLTCEKLILVWDELGSLPPAQAGAALRTYYREKRKAVP